MSMRPQKRPRLGMRPRRVETNLYGTPPGSGYRFEIRDIDGVPTLWTEHDGPRASLPDVYAAAEAWLTARGMSATGPVLETRAPDSDAEAGEDAAGIELQWPVRLRGL